jgi:hypothetical protein
LSNSILYLRFVEVIPNKSLAQDNQPIADLPDKVLPQARLPCLNISNKALLAGCFQKLPLSYLGIFLPEIIIFHQKPPFKAVTPQMSYDGYQYSTFFLTRQWFFDGYK